MHRKKILSSAVSSIAVMLTLGLLLNGFVLFSHHVSVAKAASAIPQQLDCSVAPDLCTAVGDSQIFGHTDGHDEPATLFYSNHQGAGNQVRFRMTLPKDPPATTPLTPGTSFTFQLHPAFWVSMVLCDTQSYPEQVSTCTPDSDTNIVDPTVSTKHPGTAVMELQFYPPGWVSLPTGTSCDAIKWCAALTIDSLSVNPVTGQRNNPACLATVGVEPVNFAFLTKTGIAQASANPVNATFATYTPDSARDLFMNSGDNLVITMHDSPNGLLTQIDDLTAHLSGSMTSSIANGFGQVQFDPTGTSCNNIPYDFHPMYSTSSEQTSAIWTAHTFNIAFSEEIGRWDFCQSVTAVETCSFSSTEGIATDSEPSDADDTGCFPASSSLLVQVSGCSDGNVGFDGTSYQADWPDGSPLHPTAVQFSSPRTGTGYNLKYNRIAFETETPIIEQELQLCDTQTGANCSLLPKTDDGQPVSFYPFFSIRGSGASCRFQLGNHIPGSKNDFGGDNEYGQLLQVNFYLFGGGGTPSTRYFDFRQILNNSCTG